MDSNNRTTEAIPGNDSQQYNYQQQVDPNYNYQQQQTYQEPVQQVNYSYQEPQQAEQYQQNQYYQEPAQQMPQEVSSTPQDNPFLEYDQGNGQSSIPQSAIATPENNPFLAPVDNSNYDELPFEMKDGPSEIAEPVTLNQPAEKKEPAQKINLGNYIDPTYHQKIGEMALERKRLNLNDSNLFIPVLREYFKDEKATIETINAENIGGLLQHLKTLQS